MSLEYSTFVEPIVSKVLHLQKMNEWTQPFLDRIASFLPSNMAVILPRRAINQLYMTTNTKLRPLNAHPESAVKAHKKHLVRKQGCK